MTVLLCWNYIRIPPLLLLFPWAGRQELVFADSMLSSDAWPGGLYMEQNRRCMILRTGSRITFRKTTVMFGLKGKGTERQVGPQVLLSTPKTDGVPLQEKICTHTRSHMHTQTLCFACVFVFCLRGNRKVRRKERKARGMREEPAREEKPGCCGGQRAGENPPGEGWLRGLWRVGIFNIGVFVVLLCSGHCKSSSWPSNLCKVYPSWMLGETLPRPQSSGVLTWWTTEMVHVCIGRWDLGGGGNHCKVPIPIPYPAPQHTLKHTCIAVTQPPPRDVRSLHEGFGLPQS